jgi:hypothetical protein
MEVLNFNGMLNRDVHDGNLHGVQTLSNTHYPIISTHGRQS